MPDSGNTSAAPPPATEPAPPAPAPAAPAKGNARPQADYQEAFSAIDKLPGAESADKDKEASSENGQPEEKPAPAQPPTKPESKKRSLGSDLDNLVTAKTEAKPEEKPVPTPPPATAPELKTLKEVRHAYEQLKSELGTRDARVKELESAIEAARKETAENIRKELQAKLDTALKEREERDLEVRFLNYQRSGEYKEKYEEPLKKAWKAALDDIDGIRVELPDGNVREATAHDVYGLMQMPAAQARTKAVEIFGQFAAADIMRHRSKLIELQNDRDKALNDWREKGSARDAELQKAQEDQLRMIIEGFDGGIRAYQQDYPELFGTDEADKEGNEYLEKGTRLARLAFLGDGVPDGLTLEQRQEMLGGARVQVATRAAAFGRERLRNIRLQKEVEALKTKLKQYEKSEPVPDAAPRGEPGKKQNLSPEDLIDQLPSTRF